MSTLLNILANHGLMLLCGVTALLLAGAVAMIVVRSPLLRQRIGELSMVATVVWLALACIPMRRVEFRRSVQSPQPTRDLLVSSAAAPVPSNPAIPFELLARLSTALARPATAQPLPPDATPPAASEKRIDIPQFAAAIFLIGATLCIVWLMLGHVLLWRLIRRSSVAPPSVARMLISISPQRNVRVLTSPTLARPVTCGLFRPTILLPAWLLSGQNQQQLRQVLLHELGHIRQKDARGALIFNLALPLLYFHPLYWLLRRTSALARELIVDDWAARADGKEAYVTQRIALARGRVGLSLAPVGSIGILQIRSHFYRRMHMLLHRKAPLASRCSVFGKAAMAGLTVAAVATLTCLIGIRPARAADPGTSPSSSTVDGNESAKTPTADARAAFLEKFNRRQDDLWKQLQRETILVNGQPVNMKDIKARFNTELAKIKDQMKTEWAAQYPGDDPFAPMASGDPDLSVGERLRIGRAQATSATIDSEMAELRSEGETIKHRLAELKTQAIPGELSPDDQKRISILNDKLAIIERQIVSLDQRKRDLANDPLAGRDDGERPNRARPAPSDARISGVQLDVVNLANTTIDAWGALHLAEAKYARLSRLRKDGAVVDEELDVARVTYETAKKRLDLLKGIAAVALQSAEQDLKLVKATYEHGVANSQGIAEAEGKIKMLQMILNGAN